MGSRLVFVFALLVGLTGQLSGAARILGVFPTNTQSHYVMYGKLMRAMAARGHHVTVINHFPSKTPINNFIDISLDGTLPALSNNISIDVPLAMSPMGNHLDNIYDCLEACEMGLNHPEVKEVIKAAKLHKYDLFVTEIFGSECFLAIAHELGIPSVGLVSSVTLPWVNDMVANPDNPAYVPLYFYPLTQTMNFYGRLFNTVMGLVIKATYEVLGNWSAQKIAEDAFGKSFPAIGEMAKNFSLILINSHFSINQVRPWVPQIIEVGGLHIGKPGILPMDIQTFLDESEDGVVYFSFGSMIQIASIPEEKLRGVINALGSLKQRVLWKVDPTNLPELPPNIKTGLWMPQLEILCHPATKLFISHGGLLGSQEAINCGVPILGVPLFADQALNLAELDRRGVVKIINYYDVNEVSVSKAVNELINNTRYAENMKHLSQLFTDRPQHPLDTATYWLEYVIKYKGARHLRSAALKLAWYQYLLLDVIAFIFVSSLVFIYVCKKIFNRIVYQFSLEKSKKTKAKMMEDINKNNNNNVYLNEKPKTNGYSKLNGFSNIVYQNGNCHVSNSYDDGLMKEEVFCETGHPKRE